jgi:undecaprenyl-diphosphatase
MDYMITAILGLTQGLTEFLPISSSGHLVIMQHLFGITEGSLFLDILLHLGTAFAIIIVLRKDIQWLVTDSLSKERTQREAAWRYAGFIIIGTIPAGFAGVFFDDFFENLFSNPKAAGAMLLVTAVLLFISSIRKNNTADLSWWKVVIIGCAQAIAIIPGISRSGSTIAIALLIGVSRAEAGRFSFLLALPAIFGAALLQFMKIDNINMSFTTMGLGFLTSLIIGIFALKLLLKFVNQGKLHYFGFYCVIAGLASLIVL